jgi:aldehyde dehydrogenase
MPVSIGNADIERIVKAVVQSMDRNTTDKSLVVPARPASATPRMGLAPKFNAAPSSPLSMGVFASLDDAVAEADIAYRQMRSVAMRSRVVAAIRHAGEKHAQELAELAVAETGMGRVADKFVKNVSQALHTPGVECLVPTVLSGDHGLTLMENAAWGVVASVTPSTNPAATIINNAISMIAAGNTVVFAPHPAAKGVSQRAVALLNEAVVAAGGPRNVITTVAQPNIATAQALFSYPGHPFADGDWWRSGGGRSAQTHRQTTDCRRCRQPAGGGG